MLLKSVSNSEGLIPDGVNDRCTSRLSVGLSGGAADPTGDGYGRATNEGICERSFDCCEGMASGRSEFSSGLKGFSRVWCGVSAVTTWVFGEVDDSDISNPDISIGLWGGSIICGVLTLERAQVAETLSICSCDDTASGTILGADFLGEGDLLNVNSFSLLNSRTVKVSAVLWAHGWDCRCILVVTVSLKTVSRRAVAFGVRETSRSSQCKIGKRPFDEWPTLFSGLVKR